MNDLERYFQRADGPLVHKWLHYFAIYDRHLRGFRGASPTVVEFGVFHGGSLAMWREYFGPGATLIGVDIDQRCADVGGDARIVIGDQGDRGFLRSLRDQVGDIDIVIDDGGHRMTEQIGAFEVLWPAVVDGGAYVVEDVHTSYWPDYGGGPHEPGSFVALVKSLIDSIHGWHRQDAAAIDAYTRTIGGLHVYDSIVVLDKADVHAPSNRLRGRPAFPLEAELEVLWEGNDDRTPPVEGP